MESIILHLFKSSFITNTSTSFTSYIPNTKKLQRWNKRQVLFLQFPHLWKYFKVSRSFWNVRLHYVRSRHFTLKSDIFVNVNRLASLKGFHEELLWVKEINVLLQVVTTSTAYHGHFFISVVFYYMLKFEHLNKTVIRNIFWMWNKS